MLNLINKLIDTFKDLSITLYYLRFPTTYYYNFNQTKLSDLATVDFSSLDQFCLVLTSILKIL